MPRRTLRNVALSIWLSTAEHERLQAMAVERARRAGLTDPPSLNAVVRSLIAHNGSLVEVQASDPTGPRPAA